MGMVLELVTLRDETVYQLLKDPPLIRNVCAAIWSSKPSANVKVIVVRPKVSWLERLRNFFQPPKPVVRPVPWIWKPGEGESVYLDKSWHGIHYLLTGTAYDGEPPLNFIVGGHVVGDIEVGYEPAHVFFAEEVREISAALAWLDEAALRSRFNPAEMDRLEIYPSLSWEEDQDEEWEYLWSYTETLREFLLKAVEKEAGMAVFLT